MYNPLDFRSILYSGAELSESLQSDDDNNLSIAGTRGGNSGERAKVGGNMHTEME
jgi:hypothetical protein